jgi:hypothetical protein
MLRYARNTAFVLAMCGAALGCVLAGAAVALQRPAFAQVRTDTASLMRADYSSDPAQRSLPLAPEIVEDAAADAEIASRSPTPALANPPAAEEDEGPATVAPASSPAAKATQTAAKSTQTAAARTASPTRSAATATPPAVATQTPRPAPTATPPVNTDRPTPTVTRAPTATKEPTATATKEPTATATKPVAIATPSPQNCDSSGPGGHCRTATPTRTPSPTRTPCLINLPPLPPICL